MGDESNAHSHFHPLRGTAEALSGALEEGEVIGIFLAKLHRALTACRRLIAGR